MSWGGGKRPREAVRESNHLINFPYSITFLPTPTPWETRLLKFASRKKSQRVNYSNVVLLLPLATLAALGNNGY